MLDVDRGLVPQPLVSSRLSCLLDVVVVRRITPQKDIELEVEWDLNRLFCPGRCKSEPPYRPNSEPGMEAAGESLRAVDEFSLGG